ncbi:MAG: adenylate/guanylate cyclase domain-containing protein, partial [Spirochaeta sp.]
IDINLGDQFHSKLTVLFADIRGFTQISENMSPQASFTFINAFLERTGPVIREHGGFIDKYIGDAIMAIFPEDPVQAVKAAVALHHEVAKFNHAHPVYPDIRIGVSINSGPIMLGIVGEKQRLESTVISDVVNVASRLEQMNKLYGSCITISKSVYQEIAKTGFQTRYLGTEVLRGRNQHVAIYEVLDGDPEEIKRQKQDSIEDFRAAVDYMEQKQLHEARKVFYTILHNAPLDTAAHYLLAKIEQQLIL